jgi:hypothetical protein
MARAYLASGHVMHCVRKETLLEDHALRGLRAVLDRSERAHGAVGLVEQLAQTLTQVRGSARHHARTRHAILHTDSITAAAAAAALVFDGVAVTARSNGARRRRRRVVSVCRGAGARHARQWQWQWQWRSARQRSSCSGCCSNALRSRYASAAHARTSAPPTQASVL